jgi:hypothetical protein
MKTDKYRGFKMPFIGRPSDGKRKDKNGGEYWIIFAYGVTRVLKFLNGEQVSAGNFFNWNDAIDAYRINL